MTNALEQVTSVVSEVKTLIADFAETKKKLQAGMQEKLQVVFKEFLVANPEISVITWTQYTPYFNDGSSCTFSVGDFWAIPTGSSWEEGEYAEEYAISKSNKDVKVSETTQKNWDEFETVLRSIPDDIYEDMFGDHVEITVTKDKIDVEEYEHE